MSEKCKYIICTVRSLPPSQTAIKINKTIEAEDKIFNEAVEFVRNSADDAAIFRALYSNNKTQDNEMHTIVTALLC